jgi:hypothetical protein
MEEQVTDAGAATAAAEVKQDEQQTEAVGISNGHPPPEAIKESEPMEISPQQAEMAAACQDHLRHLLDIAALVRNLYTLVVTCMALM